MRPSDDKPSKEAVDLLDLMRAYASPTIRFSEGKTYNPSTAPLMIDAFARAAVVGELERLHRVTFGEFGVWHLERVRAAIHERAAELEKGTDNAKD